MSRKKEMHRRRSSRIPRPAPKKRNPVDDALILVCSVRAALKNGVLHYQDGTLLTTEHEIIDAMQKGSIEIDESQRVEVTSWEKELPALAEEIRIKAGIAKPEPVAGYEGIVKVQLPLYPPDSPALIYSEGKEHFFEMYPDGELRRRMGNKLKAYFQARIVGQTVELGPEVPEQDW